MKAALYNNKDLKDKLPLWALSSNQSLGEARHMTPSFVGTGYPMGGTHTTLQVL